MEVCHWIKTLYYFLNIVSFRIIIQTLKLKANDPKDFRCLLIYLNFMFIVDPITDVPMSRPLCLPPRSPSPPFPGSPPCFLCLCAVCICFLLHPASLPPTPPTALSLLIRFHFFLLKFVSIQLFYMLVIELSHLKVYFSYSFKKIYNHKIYELHIKKW